MNVGEQPWPLPEAGQLLTRALIAAAGNVQELVSSRDVAEALSGFLLRLRAADPRSDGSARFQRDDGIVLQMAQQSEDVVKLFGYVWWISQTVDPLWARFELNPQEQVLRTYAIKCGVRRPGDEGYGPGVSEGRHLRKLFESADPGDIGKAWYSGQLSPEIDLWFFSFRFP